MPYSSQSMTADAAPGSREQGNLKKRDPRGRLLRLLVILWAFALLTVPGLGLTDVITSLLPDGPGAMFVTAYAIVIGVIAPACLLAQLRRPQTKLPFLRETILIAVVFALTSALALHATDLLGTAVIGIVALTSVLAHPMRRRTLEWKLHLDAPLALLAVTGAIGWLGFAVVTAAKQQNDQPPHEGFGLGPDSWDTLTLLGLVIALNALVSAASFWDRKVFASCAGAASILYGAASLSRAPLPGSLSSAWSGIVIAWGIALILLVRRHDVASDEST